MKKGASKLTLEETECSRCKIPMLRYSHRENAVCFECQQRGKKITKLNKVYETNGIRKGNY